MSDSTTDLFAAGANALRQLASYSLPANDELYVLVGDVRRMLTAMPTPTEAAIAAAKVACEAEVGVLP